MQWMWNHIFKPLFKAVVDILWQTVKWAFYEPVAGVLIGGAALIGSLFFPHDDPTGTWLAVWGLSMVISGTFGWIYAAGGGDTGEFIRRVIERAVDPSGSGVGDSVGGLILRR